MANLHLQLDEAETLYLRSSDRSARYGRPVVFPPVSSVSQTGLAFELNDRSGKSYRKLKKFDFTDFSKSVGPYWPTGQTTLQEIPAGCSVWTNRSGLLRITGLGFENRPVGSLKPTGRIISWNFAQIYARFDSQFMQIFQALFDSFSPRIWG